MKFNPKIDKAMSEDRIGAFCLNDEFLRNHPKEVERMFADRWVIGHKYLEERKLHVYVAYAADFEKIVGTKIPHYCVMVDGENGKVVVTEAHMKQAFLAANEMDIETR